MPLPRAAIKAPPPPPPRSRPLREGGLGRKKVVGEGAGFVFPPTSGHKGSRPAPALHDTSTTGDHKGPHPASAPPPTLRETGHVCKKAALERFCTSHRIRAIVSMVAKMRMGTISALYWKRPLYMTGLELSRLSASVGRARMRIQGASRGR